MKTTIDKQRATYAINEFRTGFKHATSYYELYMNVLDFFKEGTREGFCVTHPDARIRKAYVALQNSREIVEPSADFNKGLVFDFDDSVVAIFQAAPRSKEVTITFSVENQNWVIGVKGNEPLSNINGMNTLN